MAVRSQNIIHLFYRAQNSIYLAYRTWNNGEWNEDLTLMGELTSAPAGTAINNQNNVKVISAGLDGIPSIYSYNFAFNFDDPGNGW